MLAGVLCPADLTIEELAEAGRLACEDRRPCGAWIWDNPEYVPAELPDAHDKLPKLSVQNALAIWVADKNEMIKLR